MTEDAIDVRGIALAAIKEARQAGESQEMLARWISERVNAARHRIAAEARQHGDGGRCDLCVGECCGHSLGRPEEWEPEAGSRASPALPDTTAIQGLKDALWEQTGLVELLCDIVDCVAEDVGHGTGQSIDSVLALLGPCNDRALEALAAVGLRPDRGEIISALEGADHG